MKMRKWRDSEGKVIWVCKLSGVYHRQPNSKRGFHVSLPKSQSLSQKLKWRLQEKKGREICGFEGVFGDFEG